jgi:hypothetical protein
MRGVLRRLWLVREARYEQFTFPALAKALRMGHPSSWDWLREERVGHSPLFWKSVGQCTQEGCSNNEIIDRWFSRDR